MEPVREQTIIWKGIYYNSIEYLKISGAGRDIVVKSKIIGTHKNQFYWVEYRLLIDEDWKIFSFNVDFEVNNNIKKITGIKHNSNWEINGKIDDRFTNFNFIDISLTPFTNTMPIKNLHLKAGEEKEINVIYINILDNYIKPVKQKYRKNADKNFRYENIPNNFEADINVDEFGIVDFYPELFERLIF